MDYHQVIYPVYQEVRGRSSFYRQTQVQIQPSLAQWQLSILEFCDKTIGQ